MSATILPLVLFAAIATTTPGIATTLSTASGARFGFWRSVPVIVGSAAGLASVTGAAGAGLAGLLLAVPSVQLAMKVVGSAYLVWLAWKVGHSGPPDLDKEMPAPIGFFAGAGLQWLNPKGWAMGLGAAASFSALATGPWQLSLLLGSTFGLSAAISLVLWCVAGMLLARLLSAAWQWRVLNGVLGLLLVASVAPMWSPA
jgi:threonine/homoserine/homoserine lactone efflux protein